MIEEYVVYVTVDLEKGTSGKAVIVTWYFVRCTASTLLRLCWYSRFRNPRACVSDTVIDVLSGNPMRRCLKSLRREGGLRVRSIVG